MSEESGQNGSASWSPDTFLVSEMATYYRIGTKIMQGILWGGFSIATVFITYRFVARWRTVRRFYLEDVFALAAWTFIAASCVLTHVLLPDLFEIFYTSPASAAAMADNEDRVPPRRNIARNLEAKAAADMLGYLALWAIKLSFLCFFRRIYENLDSWMKYWWIVMAFTIITLVATTAASIVYYVLIDYDCMSSFFEYQPRCTYEHLEHNMAVTNIDIARGACDLLTDILSKSA